MKKKANKKGFTIMEMLIVVAIIAVLVAIAIPTFNNALTKSKEAADVANIRAAYAEVMVANLTDNTAIPTEKGSATANPKTGFEAYLDSALNYDAKLTYTYTAGTQSATITYGASKLTGGNGANANTFTWTLSAADAGN